MELSSVMTVEMSNLLAVANSALRVKRRAMSNELPEFLRLARSDNPPAEQAFLEKKRSLKLSG